MPDDKLPRAIYGGIMRIGSWEIECVVLDTGERVMLAESAEKFFAAFTSGEDMGDLNEVEWIRDAE